MRLALRSLAASAAALLLLAAPTSAYKVRAGDIVPVPEADRVSAKQLFKREAEILDAGYPHIQLTITTAGRLYVRHVENATAAAAGVFGRLRASGDTRAAVEYVEFPEPGKSEYDDASDELRVSVTFDREKHAAESLLLEVELYQKNTLKELTAYGSADTVITENVLYSVGPGKFLANMTQVRAGRLVDNMKPGALFVSDPTARFTTNILTVSSDGPNPVQLDFAAINCSADKLYVLPGPPSDVRFFVAESMPPVEMLLELHADEATPSPTARSPLCVATKNDVALSVTLSNDVTFVKNSTIPGGSTCVKLALPPREPALIGGDDVFEDDLPSTGRPTLAPGSASASTPASAAPTPGSTTSIPKSGAWPLAWSPAIAAALGSLLVAFM